MTVDLLVFTDGRGELLEQTIASATEMLGDDQTPRGLVGSLYGQRHIIDDSADSEYAQWLEEKFGERFWIRSHDRRLGFGGSIRAAWMSIARNGLGRHADWFFHLEDDFVFERQVNLTDLQEIMEAHPYLVQMALLRAAYFPRELAAGSIPNEHPEAYELRTQDGDSWLEHRLFFTTNPCLYRRSIPNAGWPVGRASEQRFSRRVFRHPEARAGFWGTGEPWIHHIGSYRNGHGY